MISLKLFSLYESNSDAVIKRPLSSSFNLVSLSFRTIEVFIGDIFSIFFLAVSLKNIFLLKLFSLLLSLKSDSES